MSGYGAYSNAYSVAYDSDTEVPATPPGIEPPEPVPPPDDTWYYGEYSAAYNNAYAIGASIFEPSPEPEPEIPLFCGKTYVAPVRETTFVVTRPRKPPLERT